MSVNAGVIKCVCWSRDWSELMSDLVNELNECNKKFQESDSEFCTANKSFSDGLKNLYNADRLINLSREGLGRKLLRIPYEQLNILRSVGLMLPGFKLKKINDGILSYLLKSPFKKLVSEALQSMLDDDFIYDEASGTDYLFSEVYGLFSLLYQKVKPEPGIVGLIQRLTLTSIGLMDLCLFKAFTPDYDEFKYHLTSKGNVIPYDPCDCPDIYC